MPVYLGSRATFTLGRFGGHAGRALAAGDVLAHRRRGGDGSGSPRPVPSRRELDTRRGRIGVAYGPHGAPDFFTPDDIDDVLRDGLEGALQLQPHRRASDRAEAALGATRRR